MKKNKSLIIILCLMTLIALVAYVLLARRESAPEKGVTTARVSGEKLYVPENGNIEVDEGIIPARKSLSENNRLTVWFGIGTRDADASSEYCLLYDNSTEQIYSKWTRDYFGNELESVTSTYYKNSVVDRANTATYMANYCWK